MVTSDAATILASGMATGTAVSAANVLRSVSRSERWANTSSQALINIINGYSLLQWRLRNSFALCKQAVWCLPCRVRDQREYMSVHLSFGNIHRTGVYHHPAKLLTLQ